MKLRSILAIAALSVCSAAAARAQSSAAPATHGLAPVTVTAERHGALHRVVQTEEQRQYLLGLVDENRRLMADLRRTDAKVDQLEGRLIEAKADHDRRVAGIAAIDSAAAETKRLRLELEEKLRRLEPAASSDRDGNGSR